MSFPRYPAYKNSGIKWLGEVPEHWEMRRTKYLFELMKRPPREGDGIVTAFRDGMVTLRANRREDGFTNSIQEIGYQGVRCGDLVIHAMDGFAGAIGVSDSDGKCTPVYAVCEPKESVSAKYFSTILRHAALSGFVSSLSKGIRERSTEFRWNEAGNLSLPLPPPSEQSTIAIFLDRETGNIDALVAEQEKLIGLLKEKRQAVISHAVTKGLDPSAPMKDSGIPWLGEVPGHWEVAPLGAVTQIIQTGPFGSQLHAADYLADHVPVINPANLQEEGISPNWSNTVLSDVRDRLSEYVLKYKDIILGRRGEMGRCAVVEEREVGWLCGTGSLIIRLSEQVLPHFLSTFIRTLFVREWLALQSVGSTMDNLNAGILSRLKVPVPPQEEQILILSQLERQTAQFDTLIAEAQRAIELLKEHRSALISAAVTGKIDVRDCVALREVA